MRLSKKKLQQSSKVLTVLTPFDVNRFDGEWSVRVNFPSLLGISLFTTIRFVSDSVKMVRLSDRVVYKQQL